MCLTYTLANEIKKWRKKHTFLLQSLNITAFHCKESNVFNMPTYTSKHMYNANGTAERKQHIYYAFMVRSHFVDRNSISSSSIAIWIPSTHAQNNFTNRTLFFCSFSRSNNNHFESGKYTYRIKQTVAFSAGSICSSSYVPIKYCSSYIFSCIQTVYIDRRHCSHKRKKKTECRLEEHTVDLFSVFVFFFAFWKRVRTNIIQMEENGNETN